MPAVHLAGSGSGDCGGGDSAYFGVLLYAEGVIVISRACLNVSGTRSLPS